MNDGKYTIRNRDKVRSYGPKRRYKTGKAVLRHLLAWYKEDRANWTYGTRWSLKNTPPPGAQPEYANCALGGIERFADNNAAMHNAAMLLKHNLPQNRQSIVGVNDGPNGRKLIMAALEKAVDA